MRFVVVARSRVWFFTSLGLAVMLMSDVCEAAVAKYILGSRRASSMHVGDARPATESAGSSIIFERARSLLTGRQFAKAQMEFDAIWSSQSEEWEKNRDCVAFYRGLCASSGHDEADACLWYERAEQLAARIPGADKRRVFFHAMLGRSRLLARHDQGGEESNAADFAMVTVAEDLQRLEAARLGLREAKAQLENDPASIEKRILYTSWLFLHAEWSAQQSTSMYSTAIDQFEEGWELWQAIEDEIRRKNLHADISRKLEVAMHLDTVTVRQLAIKRRDAQARREERERLDQLRVLISAYKTSAERLAATITYLLLDDPKHAQEQNVHTELACRSVSEILGKRRDYFLFSSEPGTDESLGQLELPELRAFSDDFGSQSKAIAALLAYREALTNRNGDAAEILKQKVIPWASQAVKRSAAPANVGNPLGHYVHGLAHEAWGRMLTRQDVVGQAVRDEAEKKFRTAQLSYEAARVAGEQIRNSQGRVQVVMAHLHDNLATRMKNEGAAMAQATVQKELLANFLGIIESRAAELEKPEQFLAKANEATLTGNLRQGLESLREGMERHRDGRLWWALAEGRLRAGHDREAVANDLNAARESPILRNMIDTFSARFVAGKVLHAQLQQKLVGFLANKPVREPLPQLLRLSDQSIHALREAVRLAEDDGNRNRAKSQLAYAITSGAVLRPSGDVRSTLMKDASVLAEDAEKYFLSDEGNKVLANGQAKDVRQIEFREGLIAARLALAHCALELLPTQLVAAEEFARAIGEMALLPFGNDAWKLPGLPVLDAIKNRPENAAVLDAYVERQRRQGLKQFVDGAVALHLGEAPAAFEMMSKGLGTLQQPIPRDPRLLANTGSRFEELDVEQDLAAFLAISEIAQSPREASNRPAKTQAALIRVLAAIASKKADKDSMPDPTLEVTSPTIRDAISEARSPLLAYAVGRAIEEHVAAHGPEPLEERGALMAEVRHAYGKTVLLLDSQSTEKRYPQLRALAGQGLDRLRENGAHYLSEANVLRSHYQLAEARKMFAAGIARHPASAALWQGLISVAVEQVEIAPQPDNAAYHEILDELLPQMAAAVPEAETMRLYWEGYLNEHVGEWQRAIKAFRSVVDHPRATANERVRAAASMAVAKQRSAENFSRRKP